MNRVPIELLDIATSGIVSLNRESAAFNARMGFTLLFDQPTLLANRLLLIEQVDLIADSLALLRSQLTD
jgi:hypothetical protein